MEEGLISIIIPTYNRAELIGETLDSIIQQTYKNWECIIVDDGSSDYTKELIQFYIEIDPRIKYYSRPVERPKGANACRNFGFEKSQGEFINWFDSDDLMMPDKLSIQVGILESYNYDLSICETWIFENFSNQKLILKSDCTWIEKNLEDFIAARVAWTTSIPIWRKNFFTNLKYLFDEELQAAQEWEFFCRCLFYEPKDHFIKKPLVKIRKHNQSISFSNNEKRLRHYYKAREKIFSFLGKHNYYSYFLSSYFLHFYRSFLIEKRIRKAFPILTTQLLVDQNIRYGYKIKLISALISYTIFGKGEKFLSGKKLKTD